MLLGLTAIGSALRQVFSRFALLAGGNVTAMVLSIPLLAAVLLLTSFSSSLSFVPLGIAVFVGALPNPASMGLQVLTRDMAYDRSPDLYEQWPGLRRYWRVALKAWLISAGVTALCFLNVAFYVHQAASPTSELRGIAGPLSLLWGLLLVSWLAIHLYVAPLLLAQERPNIVLAYRNALVLTMSRPVASWTIIPIWLALLIFTSATALVTVIGLALAAAIQENALRVLLPTFSPATE